jgi:hypothetical protein
MIISCSVLRMRNASDKSCRENQHPRFMFNNFLLTIVPLGNDVKNDVGSDGIEVTIWRMRNICWIPKPTTTLSEHVIFIAASLQQ